MEVRKVRGLRDEIKGKSERKFSRTEVVSYVQENTGLSK